MYNSESVRENETHKLFWDFKNANGAPNLSQMTRPSDSHPRLKKQKKQKTKKENLPNFAVPVGHIVKIEESEKRDKYLDLAQELKKIWNMKVTVILIVTGVIGTIPKGLVQ